MAYTDDQVSEFNQKLDAWLTREEALTTEFFTREFRVPSAHELVCHGLGRRFATLKHCINRTFETLPPNETEPGNMVLMDATSHLQTFVINTYGAIDNLARIWCIESNLRRKNGNSFPIRDWTHADPQIRQGVIIPAVSGLLENGGSMVQIP